MRKKFLWKGCKRLYPEQVSSLKKEQSSKNLQSIPGSLIRSMAPLISYIIFRSILYQLACFMKKRLFLASFVISNTMKTFTPGKAEVHGATDTKYTFHHELKFQME